MSSAASIAISVSVIVLIIFLVLLAGWKASKDREQAHCEPGMEPSEKRVAVYLNKALADCPNKLIINNLMLPGIKDAKHTTQIDTLILCSKGVFIIETKSWNGRIYGNFNMKYWNVYYSDGSCHRMYNPVWQNYGHLKRVKQLIERDLGIPSESIRFIPMVIFESGDISHVRAEGCYGLKKAASIAQSYPDSLDEVTLDRLKSMFIHYKTHPVSQSYEHVQYVKSIQDRNDQMY